MLLAPVAGALLVVLVLVDVFRTVLLPASSGQLARVLPLLLRSAARRLPAGLRRRALPLVGPLSLVTTVALWLLLLLAGFALVYLPHVPELSYAPSVDFGRRGLVEALYLSGTALTTLGFGDVVGSSSTVRLLTVLEAACGLGVLTATLGYLPAIYTVVSELRTADQRVSDLGAEDVQGAAELVASGASDLLDRVRGDVLAARQHLQRFPVLHDFHPPYDESVVALARGALGLWVAAHFAREDDAPLARHRKALEQALRRLTDELGPRPRARDAAGPVATELFRAARDAAADRGHARAAVVPDEHVQLLAALHEALDHYARRHCYPVAAGSRHG